ncbi:hypothetical protein COU78_04915 [Candidatus Peregrinibacteria bacterium CG10_big_fil_rev_8_21_14_0_10_49_24]|nr:MAG: hypothetical protein COV83_04060 [Candidatus Peregrinibacteria bacterium CG11_big_fil_rev_8_21_14_0_20_49_14]PIR50690.1 MAG: hypothetical protein COU78_04915 [Candidatus Peregrinibacteria bacterium CG10_big_fil_rev_8_21_14_0_10_49_24]PJA67452.1 MAG: hypothetical protein CO157_04615 [Candidatus Peregrinibacteria bacterium CG_4_9_14_3_um_filter_49_12]
MKAMNISSLGTVSKKFRNIVRTHWKKLLIAIAVGIPVLGISYFLLHEKKPEYITDIARRGKLIQTVEAVGTVISEKDLDLKFPVTGVVENVYVMEGDTVEAGQVLAELRNNSLEADVASASANYQAALADLRELEEGTRPEEILIAEAEVENKRAALSAAKASLEAAERNLDRSQQKLDELRREADTSLSGHVSTAGSVIAQELTKIQNSLQELDDDFDTTVIRNAVDFRARIEYDIYLRKREDAEISISYGFKGSNPSNFASALSNLEEAKQAALEAVEVANSAYAIVVSLPTTNYLTTSVKETYKDSVATQRDAIQAAYNNIEDEMKVVRDASANFSSKIAAEEASLTTSQGTKDRALADIATYRTSLQIQEAQLALKRAGARKADIDSARASVNRAYAEVQRARAKLDDTILIAPIGGSITKVNLKTGEFTGGIEDYERAITMLGDSPYRIEMYASEIDIPKVTHDQEGAIELDAYQGRDFLIHVSEIDPAATTVDGVPKYRIKLDFLENEESSLKIGMTGDVDIITGIRDDVVMVSGRAVIKNVLGEDIVRILKDDALEERTVVTGMETDTDVEIISGVEEGEIVIVLIKE